MPCQTRGGDFLSSGGACREEGEEDRRTAHHEKIRKRPTGRARKRIKTGRLNKKWRGGHAKTLREGESSAGESQEVQGEEVQR
jgi:hypothetical protein